MGTTKMVLEDGMGEHWEAELVQAGFRAGMSRTWQQLWQRLAEHGNRSSTSCQLMG